MAHNGLAHVMRVSLEKHPIDLSSWSSWFAQDWVDVAILLVIITWFLMDRFGYYFRKPT